MSSEYKAILVVLLSDMTVLALKLAHLVHVEQLETKSKGFYSFQAPLANHFFKIKRRTLYEEQNFSVIYQPMLSNPVQRVSQLAEPSSNNNFI